MKRQPFRTSPVPRNVRDGPESRTPTAMLQHLSEKRNAEVENSEHTNGNSASSNPASLTDDCFTRWISSSKSTGTGPSGALVTSEGFRWASRRSPSNPTSTSQSSMTCLPSKSLTESKPLKSHVPEWSVRLPKSQEDSQRRHHYLHGHYGLPSTKHFEDLTIRASLRKEESLVGGREDDKGPLAMLSWKSSSSEESPTDDALCSTLCMPEKERLSRESSAGGSLPAVAVCIDEASAAAGSSLKHGSYAKAGGLAENRGETSSERRRGDAACLQPAHNSTRSCFREVSRQESNEECPSPTNSVNFVGTTQPLPRRKRARYEEPMPQVIISDGRWTETEKSEDPCNTGDRVTGQGYSGPLSSYRSSDVCNHVDPVQDKSLLSNTDSCSSLPQSLVALHEAVCDRQAPAEHRVLSVFFRGGLAFAKLHVNQMQHGLPDSPVSDSILCDSTGCDQKVQRGSGSSHRKMRTSCTALSGNRINADGVPISSSTIGSRCGDQGRDINRLGFATRASSDRRGSNSYAPGVSTEEAQTLNDSQSCSSGVDDRAFDRNLAIDGSERGHQPPTAVPSRQKRTESCTIQELDLRTASKVAPASLLEYYVDRDIEAAAAAARVPSSSEPSAAIGDSSVLQVHNHYQGANFFLVVSDLNPSVVDMENLTNHASSVL